MVEVRIPPGRLDVAWYIGPVTEQRTSLPAPQRPAPNPSTRKVQPTMSFALTDTQQVSFAVSGTDARGNPANLTGTPVFAVDNPDVLTLTDNGDGTGTVAATGQLGTAVLSVTDSETNGDQFAGSVSIDVLAGNVTAVAIDLGTPEDIPTA